MKMRVFIAGATGVLGRRVVKLLIDDGHEVIGLSRSAQNSEALAAQGAEARMGDLFNKEQMRQLTADCEAVLHLATAIPNKARTTAADWALNDKIRIDGSASLIDAVLHNGCKIYLQQSITILYGSRSGEWVDEMIPISSALNPLTQSAGEMEKIVQRAVLQNQLPAIVLRFGTFYSHDSSQTAAMFAGIRAGSFPVIGSGANYWNIIQVDDAAAAVRSALAHYEAGLGQTFNVCDDEPVRYRDLMNFIAQTLQAKKPRSVPPFLARWMVGGPLVEMLLASVRCKNQRVKETLGWKPQYPTYREGYQAEIEKWLARAAEHRS